MLQPAKGSSVGRRRAAVAGIILGCCFLALPVRNSHSGVGYDAHRIHNTFEGKYSESTSSPPSPGEDDHDFGLEQVEICAKDQSCACENAFKQELASMMHEAERNLTKNVLRGASTYFEWGSGGSTVAHTQNIHGLSVSIENFPPWCEKLKRDKYISCKIAKGELRYNCIDQGVPMSDSGHLGRGKSDLPSYSLYIDAISSTWWRYDNDLKPVVVEKWDVVLVDGRSRVACALKALEHIDDDSVVLFHDWQYRPEYHKTVLRYYNILDEALPGLVALQRKPGVKSASVQDKLHARSSSL